MYIIWIRTVDEKLIEVSTDGNNVIKLCNHLENSANVKNFKVSNDCGPLCQSALNMSGFEKWVNKFYG